MKATKRMFCVEVSHRYFGDLGASIIVLASDVVDAVAEARRKYPEYTDVKEAGGRVFEVGHVHHDWSTGQTFITKLPIRVAIKPLPRLRESREESK